MEEKLDKLLKNSYSPYSKFSVAAILVCRDGEEFNGVNVENISFGATVCAERSAIFSAVSAGYKRDDFRELHIKSLSGEDITPCFMCRQVMAELFNDDVKIICHSSSGVRTYTKVELCVFPFGSKEL